MKQIKVNVKGGFLFLFAEAGYLCIPAVLPILKEVASSYEPKDNSQNQEDQEDAASVILGVVANIFQKIIEVLARYLRKEPEEGKKVCFLFSLVKSVFSFITCTCFILTFGLIV